jgi:hypothetical protein
LWQRFIQSIFGEPYSLQGDWLGRQEQLTCEEEDWCDTFDE